VAEPVEARRNVGILPEQESPPSFLTPREYFDFVGSVRDIDREVLVDRVDAWADRLYSHVGIVREGRLVTEQDPGTLSHGESLLDTFLADVKGGATT